MRSSNPLYSGEMKHSSLKQSKVITITPERELYRLNAGFNPRPGWGI